MGADRGLTEMGRGVAPDKGGHLCSKKIGDLVKEVYTYIKFVHDRFVIGVGPSSGSQKHLPGEVCFPTDDESDETGGTTSRDTVRDRQVPVGRSFPPSGTVPSKHYTKQPLTNWSEQIAWSR